MNKVLKLTAAVFMGLSLATSALASTADKTIPPRPFEVTEANIGDEGVGLVAFEDMSKEVQKAFGDVDIAFELGDGYYDYRAGAYYEIYDAASGKFAGYMEVALTSYTEDAEYVVAAAYISADGERLANRAGEILFEKDRFSRNDKERLAEYPAELQPEEE